jgi:hypothetical protein
MMRKYLACALAIAILTISCTGNFKPTEISITRASPSPTLTSILPLSETRPPPVTPTPTIAPSATTTATSTVSTVSWDVYDPSSQHLWNRLYRQLYARTTKDGKEYGRDSLDLLAWGGVTYLLEDPAYQQAIQLLDEFLSTHGEKLVTDPLKRALFQRDLWAVFDWLQFNLVDHPTQRQAMQSRLVQVVQRLALTKQEIQSLPDNYAAAVDSSAYPANYQQENGEVAFLPADFFAPNGDWVCLGREGGPTAMIHVQNYPFLGRSAFLVFIRVPGGRTATLNFLHQLRQAKAPDLSVGTEVALVRRLLLIDKQGEIIPSAIVESIQLRHFSSSQTQVFYEFTLSRDRLFAGETGGLRPLDRDERGFPLFLFSGVNFPEMDSQEVESEMPFIVGMCHICHEHVSTGIRTIFSYSRDVFPLSSDQSPLLMETTPALEAQATIAWKLRQESWQALQMLWHKTTP